MKTRNATRKELARSIFKAAAATLGLVVCATVFIQTARADCGSYTSTGRKPMSTPTQRRLQKPVAYRLTTQMVTARDDDRDRDFDAAIFFIWKLHLPTEGTTEPPDGTVN